MPLTYANDNDSIYNDIDEVLAAPPSSLMRYGNTTFLFVIIIVFSILIIVKYTDGIDCTAVVTNLNVVETNSTDTASVIKQVFIQTDTFVNKNDNILAVTSATSNTIDTVKASCSGKITLHRKLNRGDVLDEYVPLFSIRKSQSIFKIKLLIRETTDVLQIHIGQHVKINIGNEFGNIDAEIISQPYQQKSKNTFIVDANFNDRVKISKMHGFKEKNCSAFIALQRKSLFTKIF